MTFLVDNQLPVALARFLASRGVSCQHVLDLGFGGTSDVAIWDYAGRNDCIVISKDEDFFYLANAPAAKARLVWIRIGNCRKTQLLDLVERMWPRIVAGLKAGDRIIELR